jgi:hypothetical protein
MTDSNKKTELGQRIANGVDELRADSTGGIFSPASLSPGEECTPTWRARKMRLKRSYATNSTRTRRPQRDPSGRRVSAGLLAGK